MYRLWVLLIVLSLGGIGWNIYSLYHGVETHTQWYMILLSSLGLVGGVVGLKLPITKLLGKL